MSPRPRSLRARVQGTAALVLFLVGPSQARTLSQDTAVADAATDAAEWPAAFPPGMYQTSIIKTGPEYSRLQDKTGMFFSHAGVKEALLYQFCSLDPSEIVSASLHTLQDVETREDGSATIFISASASMATPVGALMSKTRCISVCLDETDGATAYLLVKNNAASLDDCPPTPTPADFITSNGENLDLAKLNADGAIIATLQGPEDDLSKADEWPDDLPGMWRGDIIGVDVTGVDAGTPLTVYASIHQGVAPNAWLFVDPEDPTVVVAANVGSFAGETKSADGGRAWRNDALKWRTTTGVYFDGYANWCNSVAMSEDGNAMVMLSDEAAPVAANSDSETELKKAVPETGLAACPKSPGKDLYHETRLTVDLLTENDATSLGTMTKM